MTEQELYEKARQRAANRPTDRTTLIVEVDRGFVDGLTLSFGKTNEAPILESESNQSFGMLVGMLSRVEAIKGKAYQASFCKRGLRGIFSNMERKWDRLDAIITRGGESNSTESMMTNAADLAVYAIKLMAWQAEMKPQEFQDWVKEVQGLK